MIKIIIRDGVEPSVFNELKKRGYLVREGKKEQKAIFHEVEDNEILIIRSATKITREIIDHALETGALKLIIRAGVGTDNIDAEYARQKGITVLNTPDASSTSVAELALTHILVLARKMVLANLSIRKGNWNKKECLGIEISGKTLGIIGMGRIGQVLAQKASALGMKIIYFDIAAPEDIDLSWKSLSLLEVLNQSDFISLHISSEGNNGYLIDEPHFKMMKKSAFLINTARGKLVNEDALLEALNKNIIAGAGIDVYCQEPCKNISLLNHERISVTPHIGASTKEAQLKIGQEVIRLIEEYHKKKNKEQ